MTAPTQLSLYNNALLALGEEKLSATTDVHKSRYALDRAYADVLQEALEAGSWNWAIREAKFDSDTSVTPTFGFTEIFAKPSDWVRTFSLSSSDSYYPALPDSEYSDVGANWSSNVTPLYIKYVSNDASYGLNLSLWPRSFTRFVELLLAERVCESISQNATKYEMLSERLVPRARRNALNKDAMNEGTKFLPPTSWTLARGGGRGSGGTLRGGYPPQV